MDYLNNENNNVTMCYCAQNVILCTQLCLEVLSASGTCQSKEIPNLVFLSKFKPFCTYRMTWKVNQIY